MSGRRSWTLFGRLTRWFTAAVLGGLMVVVLPTGWFLMRSQERAIEGLLSEELDEFCIQYPRTARDEPSFVDLALDLDARHPANRFGWRLIDLGRGMELVAGATELLPPQNPGGEEPPRDARWASAELEGGGTILLAIDAAPQLALLRNYGWFALLWTGLGALTGLLLAMLFSRRISLLLRHIAARVRTDTETGTANDAVGPENLPEEIRPVSEALDERIAELGATLASSRMMTAGLAHELRSPIQNLIGATEVALLGEPDRDELRQVLASHLHEFHDLADAVDNLVALCARPDAAPRARERFDLAHEAELRLAREREQAAREGVTFTLRHSGDTTLHGDREALLRAVRNLTANGVAWCPPGGRVEVDLHGDEDAVRIEVQDSGPGVESGYEERVFEPFVRGPAVAGRRTGYGLGLAIVKSAAEAHDGEVTVGRSELGGARFTLTVPRAIDG